MIQSGGFLTDISRVTSTVDNNFKFPSKWMNSHSNEISNINNKKFIRIMTEIFIQIHELI